MTMNVFEDSLNFKSEIKNELQLLRLSSTQAAAHFDGGDSMEKVSNETALANNELESSENSVNLKLFTNLERNGEKCAEVYLNDGEIIYYCILCPNKFNNANSIENHLFQLHYKHITWYDSLKCEEYNEDEKDPLPIELEKIIEPLCKIEPGSDSDANLKANSRNSKSAKAKYSNISSEETDEDEPPIRKRIKKSKANFTEKKSRPKKALKHDKKDDDGTDENKLKKNFKSEDNVKKIIVEGVERYQCNYCNKHYANKKSLAKHERNHTGEVKYHICEQCGKALTSSGSLRDHMRIHTGEKSFKCDVCGNLFRTLSQLTNHKITHSDKRNFRCSYCDATWQTKAHLVTHERIHTGEKPYVCHTCGEKFATPSRLKTHTNRHFNIKKHVCEICKNSFLLRQELLRHMMVHSNEKNFICDTCNMAYKYIWQLKQHKKTHLGIKEYSCKICGEEFIRYSKVYHHIKTHHGDVPVNQNFLYQPVGGRNKGGRPRKDAIKNLNNPSTANIIEATITVNNTDANSIGQKEITSSNLTKD